MSLLLSLSGGSWCCRCEKSSAYQLEAEYSWYTYQGNPWTHFQTAIWKQYWFFCDIIEQSLNHYRSRGVLKGSSYVRIVCNHLVPNLLLGDWLAGIKRFYSRSTWAVWILQMWTAKYKMCKRGQVAVLLCAKSNTIAWLIARLQFICIGF